jgi:RimJ/RimL family protein N-acetyltransferase
MLALYADPEAMRFIGGVELDAKAVIGRWLERWKANGFGHFAVERRTDGRLLGRTGIIAWDTRNWHIATISEAGKFAQPELGWAFVREHWGNGYATEAASAVRTWARKERELGRLISLIHPDNTASQRVAKRLGAEPTETVTLGKGVACVVWVHPA